MDSRFELTFLACTYDSSHYTQSSYHSCIQYHDVGMGPPLVPRGVGPGSDLVPLLPGFGVTTLRVTVPEGEHSIVA